MPPLHEKRDKIYFLRKKTLAWRKRQILPLCLIGEVFPFATQQTQKKEEQKWWRPQLWDNPSTTLIQLWKRLRSGEACQVAWADSDPQWDAACVFQPCDDSARKWGQARPMGAQACSTLRSHWSRAVCHQRWSVWESFSRDTGGEAGIRLAGVVTNYFNCFTTAHNCSKLIFSCKEQLLRNCAQIFTIAKNYSKLNQNCKKLLPNYFKMRTIAIHKLSQLQRTVQNWFVVAKNNCFATAHKLSQLRRTV